MMYDAGVQVISYEARQSSLALTSKSRVGVLLYTAVQE